MLSNLFQKNKIKTLSDKLTTKINKIQIRMNTCFTLGQVVYLQTAMYVR